MLTKITRLREYYYMHKRDIKCKKTTFMSFWPAYEGVFAVGLWPQCFLNSFVK